MKCYLGYGVQLSYLSIQTLWWIFDCCVRSTCVVVSMQVLRPVLLTQQFLWEKVASNPIIRK